MRRQASGGGGAGKPCWPFLGSPCEAFPFTWARWLPWGLWAHSPPKVAFCSQESVLELQKWRTSSPPCDLIKSKTAAQSREETPTLTAGQKPLERCLAPGMAAVCAREVMARKAPSRPKLMCAGKDPGTDLTIFTAKDNALDGSQVQMSAGDLTPWPESLLRLRGAQKELGARAGPPLTLR